MLNKMWPVVIIAIVFGFTVPAIAQNTITGRIINENGEALIYATAVLLNPADSTAQYWGVADKEGKFEIKYVKGGTYLLQYSYVGMEVLYEKITITSESMKNFGDKVLKAAANMREVIEITAERIPIEFSKDTVRFDAKAFNVKTGAVAEDLLKKIPGIEVDKSGNMKALGEDVTKVLVDGKEFFSGDPKVATKNLPADAIDKVEVYDKKSEEAEFMGIDDGIQDRTINLLLNEDSKKGYFGNVDGGGGAGEYYKAKGDVYRFSSSFQGAILGMFNNVNEFGYTSKGQGNFGQQVSGENSTGAGGINLMYNAEKYNRYYISYLLTSTETDLKQNTSTENFIQDGSYYQDSDMTQNETDTPQNLRFGIHHRFTDRHNIIIRGNANLTTNKGLTNTLTGTDLNNTPVNNLDNTSNSKSTNGSFFVNANDIIKLYKNNTQLKTNLSASYSKSESELDYNNIISLFDPASSITNNQFQDNNTDNLSFNMSPTLVQKITPFWYMTAGLGLSSIDRELDRELGTSNTVIDSLSANFNTKEFSLTPSLSFQRNTNKTFLNLSLGGRWIKFDKVFEHSSLGKSDYFYFQPRISYRNMYREGRRFEAGMNVNAAMPALNQLLPITNTVNQLSLYSGNIGLKPELRHTAYLRWSVFDQFSFTSFFTSLNAGYTKDKISMSQSVNEDLTKITMPVNVPYNYYFSLNSNFSTPIRKFGINVNIKANELYSKGNSIVNSEDNFQTMIRHSIDLSFENRGQSDLNYSIGGSVSRTNTKYSIAENMNNTYYNTTYYSEIYYTPGEQWIFGTNANIVNYNSESFADAVSIPLINASISYYFLEGGRAGLVLQGVDLLKKFTNFQQTNGVNYIMETDRNALGRYVMLTFKLRFGSGIGRGFGGKMR
ncbi:outer membrane beta-barrel protein [candidate division KSB1 bacterium]